ncbi:glycoside hydrolase family 32 protein [Gilvibacter sp.]|uniref:glycoside hydrolase family 32 protein n=1 Tax=Gilvibacter sp. TaxID=2729997 RepID=UPI003F49D41F
MRHLLFLTLLVLIGCKETTTQQTPVAQAFSSNYDEPYRLQYHFSPPAKWMNDPNGLVYNDGVYHLFYQYYPEDIVWGPMHWGHATSTDMVHWENKPIALYPDEHGLIFSGSAVVDHDNTSGFGKDGVAPLVAIFTYHLMEGEKAGRTDFQTQGIAYSLDNGDSWTKYEGNPVIGNEGIKDFRDPKVFWDKDTEQWVMILVAGDHAKFYKSPNLKDWELMSEFGKDQGAHGGVWECPDLFPLDHPDPDHYAKKWVLLISMNPGAPNGGSGTQYFIGDWDGEKFNTDQEEPLWLDYGMDNYAGVTYNNEPNNERIFIGWMSNWNYARNTPTEAWRSSMTLPRTLKLKRFNEGVRLTNYPYDKVDTLVYDRKPVYYTEGPGQVYFDSVNLNQHRIQFKTSAKTDTYFILSNNLREEIEIGFFPEAGKMTFDRSQSGKVDFESSFGAQHQEQPFKPDGDDIYVTAYIDASSIEIFVDWGRYVFTNQIFPNEPFDEVQVVPADAAGVRWFRIDSIPSIWNKPTN